MKANAETQNNEGVNVMCPKPIHPPLERQTEDRRLQEEGPPAGWGERRHAVERRLPEVQEGVVSCSEWEVYHAVYVASHGSVRSDTVLAAIRQDRMDTEQEEDV